MYKNQVDESQSISKEYNTTIINPGPVNTGRYAILEINNKLDVNASLESIYSR